MTYLCTWNMEKTTAYNFKRHDKKNKISMMIIIRIIKYTFLQVVAILLSFVELIYHQWLCDFWGFFFFICFEQFPLINRNAICLNDYSRRQTLKFEIFNKVYISFIRNNTNELSTNLISTRCLCLLEISEMWIPQKIWILYCPSIFSNCFYV